MQPYKTAKSWMASRRQRFEQRLRFLRIERVEAVGKPPVDRSEQFASLVSLARIASA
jgi:hypothetical protein